MNQHRRWRRTNFERAEPGHISFHISDFYSYDESVSWGHLAKNYIQSKGDPQARRRYRNHHEGLPYEIQETKTDVADILRLRGPYKRSFLPWKPQALILAADVGLTYVKWSVTAFRRTIEHGDGEAAVIDWGKELHPDHIALLMQQKKYFCPETGESYGISIGFCDAKYRKLDVHRACLRIPRKLYPSAGISADLSIRAISFNRGIPQRPRWFGVLVYVDRDAKHELYTERIRAWAEWDEHGKDDKAEPLTPRLWFPEDVHATEDGKKFVDEHTKEHLIEIPGAMAAKQFVWKRRGDNEGGDCSKVACVGWRFFMLGTDPLESRPDDKEAAEIAAAINV